MKSRQSLNDHCMKQCLFPNDMEDSNRSYSFVTTLVAIGMTHKILKYDGNMQRNELSSSTCDYANDSNDPVNALTSTLSAQKFFAAPSAPNTCRNTPIFGPPVCRWNPP